MEERQVILHIPTSACMILFGDSGCFENTVGRETNSQFFLFCAHIFIHIFKGDLLCISLVDPQI